MRALVLALLALAVPARAESIAYGGDAAPPTKLGFRFGGDHVPLAGGTLATIAVGIGVEHPVFRALRVLAEYEWMWLQDVPDDPGAMPGVAGMGHRTQLGLRRAFAEKDLEVLRLYADIELGGGLGLYETPTGVEVEPHGFVGLRAGYELRAQRERSARTLEIELHVRAIVVEHGVGFGGGIGLAWGS